MRKTILIIAVLSLFGCSKSTELTDSLTDIAHQNIADIRDSLPKECKTSSINNKLDQADKIVDSVAESCEVRINTEKQEKIRWKYSFLGLLLVICLYIAKRVIK